ncbi:glycoside hydrolase family 5 protein [Hortaea werneckii]|nr:glycoside hydrolase family 5 protein [Hortaea werneckii]
MADPAKALFEENEKKAKKEEIWPNLRSVKGWGKMPLSMRRWASHSGDPSVFQVQKIQPSRLAPGLDVVAVVAGADVGGARVGAVVAGADAVAVQRRGAVGHGRRPFADDGPFVRAGVDARVIADVLAMLPGLHGNELVGEALVLVVIHGDPLGVVVGWRQPAVVGRWVTESIVDDLRALVAITITLELGSHIEIDSVAGVSGEGFVKKLDTSDDIIVARVTVLVLDLLKRVQSLLDIAVLLPDQVVGPLTRVVETVLRSGGAIALSR